MDLRKPAILMIAVGLSVNIAVHNLFPSPSPSPVAPTEKASPAKAEQKTQLAAKPKRTQAEKTKAIPEIPAYSGIVVTPPTRLPPKESEQ